MIRAGRISEVALSSGHWLILDIGFANRSRTCALMVNNKAPVVLRFNEAVESISTFISKSREPVNLLIEAPLSAAFDKIGNPTGRSVEKKGSQTRYWYAGLGCTVMVAAMYLIKAITIKAPHSADVRLFEGFVSFRERGIKSNHVRDVELLREVIENPDTYPEAIIEPEALRMTESDILKSAFWVAGIDAGIPPIIVRNG